MNKIDYYSLFARIALALAFLSAVMDRFGLWTTVIGKQNVAWGNMDSFTSYTSSLMPYMPVQFVPLFAWTATIAEIILGILLLCGLFKKLTYLASGILLLIFGFSMMFFVSIKSPFDYSVFAAAACCFLLYRNTLS